MLLSTEAVPVMRHRLPFFLPFIFAAVPVLAADAPEPALDPSAASQAFEDLFGREMARVQATRTTKDDADLAKNLLEAAHGEKVQPALLDLLCDAAFKLGSADPDGEETALAAMALLAEKSPARRREALAHAVTLAQKRFTQPKPGDKAAAAERLVDLLAQQADAEADAHDYDAAAVTYRRAMGVATASNSPKRDAIKIAADTAAARRKALAEIETQKTALKANPADHAAAKQLLRLLVVEMNDPAGARLYTFLSDDPAWATNVVLATRPLGEVSEEACANLGGWYRELSDGATPTAKANMLTRAWDYYATFVELHETKDDARVLAKTALKEIEAALEKVRPASVSSAVPINLAAASRGGTVAGPGRAALMLDESIAYDGSTGYVSVPYPATWTITLAKPAGIREVRFLFYSLDERSYNYTLQTSADGSDFKTVADRSSGKWSGWQSIKLSGRPIKSLRLNGVRNTANTFFHVVEFEAYAVSPPPETRRTDGRPVAAK
jgi:hypothetical protein